MKRIKNKKFITITAIIVALLLIFGIYSYNDYNTNLETFNTVVEKFETAETREEKLSTYNEIKEYNIEEVSFIARNALDNKITEAQETILNELVKEYADKYDANLIVEGTNKNDKELEGSIKEFTNLKKQIAEETLLTEEEVIEYNTKIDVEIDKHKVLLYNLKIKAFNDKVGKVVTSGDAKTIQGDVDKLKKTIQEDKGLNEESIKNLVTEIDKTIKAAKDKHDALAKSEKEAAEKAEAERLAAEAAAQAAAQATYNNTGNYSNSGGGSSNTQATTRPAAEPSAPVVREEMCTIWTGDENGENRVYETKPCKDFWY